MAEPEMVEPLASRPSLRFWPLTCHWQLTAWPPLAMAVEVRMAVEAPLLVTLRGWTENGTAGDVRRR